jgi:nucleoside-diphosphate-sugar epimerase
VSWFHCDAKDADALRRILSGHHFNAVIDFMNYSTAEFKDRADWLVKHTDHYLFLSSARVFDHSPGAALTEESPRLLDTTTDKTYLRTDEYALSKARQENILRSLPRTNWTILRPYITYSTNRFQFGTLEADSIFHRARIGLPISLPVGMDERLTTLTWAGDVARMICSIILEPGAFGQDFNLARPTPVSWTRVGEMYSDALGLRWAADSSLRRFTSFIGGRYQVVYDRMFDRVFASNKISSFAGAIQFKSLSDGLNAELSNAGSGVSPPNWFKEGGMDRLVGARQATRKLPARDKLRYALGRHPTLRPTVRVLRRALP